MFGINSKNLVSAAKALNNMGAFKRYGLTMGVGAGVGYITGGNEGAARGAMVGALVPFAAKNIARSAGLKENLLKAYGKAAEEEARLSRFAKLNSNVRKDQAHYIGRSLNDSVPKVKPKAKTPMMKTKRKHTTKGKKGKKKLVPTGKPEQQWKRDGASAPYGKFKYEERMKNLQNSLTSRAQKADAMIGTSEQAAKAAMPGIKAGNVIAGGLAATAMFADSGEGFATGAAATLGIAATVGLAGKAHLISNNVGRRGMKGLLAADIVVTAAIATAGYAATSFYKSEYGREELLTQTRRRMQFQQSAMGLPFALHNNRH